MAEHNYKDNPDELIVFELPVAVTWRMKCAILDLKNGAEYGKWWDDQIPCIYSETMDWLEWMGAVHYIEEMDLYQLTGFGNAISAKLLKDNKKLN